MRTQIGQIEEPDDGSAPTVAGTDVPVWELAAYWDRRFTDDEILKGYPELQREDLDAAWRYYVDHRTETLGHMKRAGWRISDDVNPPVRRSTPWLLK